MNPAKTIIGACPSCSCTPLLRSQPCPDGCDANHLLDTYSLQIGENEPEPLSKDVDNPCIFRSKKVVATKQWEGVGGNQGDVFTATAYNVIIFNLCSCSFWSVVSGIVTSNSWGLPGYRYDGAWSHWSSDPIFQAVFNDSSYYWRYTITRDCANFTGDHSNEGTPTVTIS